MTTNEFFHRFVDKALPMVGDETIEFFVKLDELGEEKLEKMSDCYYKWESETPDCVKERLDRDELFNILSFDDYIEYQDQYKFEYHVKITDDIKAKVKEITSIIPAWNQIEFILQETLAESWLFYALLEYWVMKFMDEDKHSPIFLKFLGDDFMK